MNGQPQDSTDRDEQLVAELHRLGVRHLVRLREAAPLELSPTELIQQLAQHPQARFRSALILLFLRRPSLSQFVPAALAGLDDPAANTLRLYYQAAAYLCPEVHDALLAAGEDPAPFPDLFSTDLGVPAPGQATTAAALAALGRRHAELTGLAYNWSGAYRQNLPLFLRQLRSTAHVALKP